MGRPGYLPMQKVENATIPNTDADLRRCTLSGDILET